MLMNMAMRVPEAWRMLRISMRPSRITMVSSVSFITCLVMTAFVFFIFCVANREPGVMLVQPAVRITPEFRNYFCIVMMIYQMFLWCICVPAIASSSVSQEFSLGTWVFQSTTPQSASLLMLGKLLGSTGDVISASVAGLPFLLLSLAMSEISIIGMVKTIIFMFAFAAFMSCAFLYISCLIKYQKRNAVGVVALIPLLIMFSLPVLLAEGNAIGYLHPVGAFQLFLFTPEMISKSSVELLSAPQRIMFFGVAFPIFPFTIAFYSFLSFWFFKAAEGQMKEKMGTPNYRFYIMFLLASFDVLYAGLIFNFDFIKTDWMVPVLVFTLLNMIMIYSTLFLHTGKMSDIRPWAYGLPEKGISFKYLFKDSAPMAFTALILLAIYSIGVLFLALEHPFPSGGWFIVIVQIATVFVIVMRDSLFFQALYLKWKSPYFIGAAIYIIGFMAFPSLLLILTDGTPMIDLTPVTALAAAPMAEGELANKIDFILTYVTGNGLIALLSGWYCVGVLRRARETFKNKQPR